MHYKRPTPILAAVIALSLAVLACGGGRAAATATPDAAAVDTPRPTRTPRAEVQASPEPTNEPTSAPTQSGGIVAGEIEVRNASSYVDEYDYYHVVGEVFNGTERSVTNLELTVEVFDAAGVTVLTDGSDTPIDSTTFGTLLYTLAPGESSPFDFYVSGYDLDTSSWDYAVRVTGQSTASVNRGSLVVMADQVTTDQYGTLYMSGELVNLSDEPVLVSSLAGALLDEAGTVLAADASYSHSRYLAPAGDASGNDRTPFILTLDGPVEGYTQTAFYWDADLTDPIATANNVSVAIANGYVDAFDRQHLVVVLTNGGAEMLNVSLVAGLYAEDGTVLDAVSLVSHIYVAPGESVPATFEYFSSVNNNPEELARVDAYSVQIDPYWTYETTWEVVALETDHEVNEMSTDGILSFEGDVLNTSTEQLSNATLILAIYDADDNLVASSWTNVFPEGEVIEPGDALPFEVTLYLPAGTDTSNFSFRTFVQGYVD